MTDIPSRHEHLVSPAEPVDSTLNYDPSLSRRVTLSAIVLGVGLVVFFAGFVCGTMDRQAKHGEIKRERVAPTVRAPSPTEQENRP
jgi:hypothetical protein